MIENYKTNKRRRGVIPACNTMKHSVDLPCWSEEMTPRERAKLFIVVELKSMEDSKKDGVTFSPASADYRLGVDPASPLGCAAVFAVAVDGVGFCTHAFGRGRIRARGRVVIDAGSKAADARVGVGVCTSFAGGPAASGDG